MRSGILSNILKYLKKPKAQYTCYLCDPHVDLKNLKHLKFHTKKYHPNKVGIVYNR